MLNCSRLLTTTICGLVIRTGLTDLALVEGNMFKQIEDRLAD
jgi:hypothetical protein